MTFPAVRSSSMADRRAIALMQMKLLGELFLKHPVLVSDLIIFFTL